MAGIFTVQSIITFSFLGFIIQHFSGPYLLCRSVINYLK